MIKKRIQKTFSLLLFVVLLIGSLSVAYFSEQEMLSLKEENAKQLVRLLAQSLGENQDVLELEETILHEEGYDLYLLDSTGLLLAASSDADLEAIKDPNIQQLIGSQKPSEEVLALSTKLKMTKYPWPLSARYNQAVRFF